MYTRYDGLTPADIAHLARGSYQEQLLAGLARWSGADLRGKAKEFGAQYARSRKNLVRRIVAAGYRTEFVYALHGRKILVISKGGQHHVP